MRKVGLCLSLLAVALFASQAFAFTTDGNWSDWFTYHGNPSLNDWQQGNYTLTNLNIRRLADEEGPTPGGGGQPFDIEEIFYFWDDFDPEDGASGGIIRVGLVTGFNSAGVNVSGTWYYAGDMFFDFGNTGGYDAAVGVGTENTVQNNGGARFGNAWGNSGVPNWTLQGVVVPAYSDSNPYRVDERAGAIPLPGRDGRPGGQLHNFLQIALTVDGGIEDYHRRGQWRSGPSLDDAVRERRDRRARRYAAGRFEPPGYRAAWACWVRCSGSPSGLLRQRLTGQCIVWE